jgi:3-methyladenine DNA glycosylase AlkD
MNMIKEIKSILKDNATEGAKISTLKFVPNAKKVYGVKMPVLNELAKTYRHGGLDLVNQLWSEGSYEERILAAKLLGKTAKQFPLESIAVVRKNSADIDNWALCDTLGMQSLKPIVKSHAEEIFTLSEKLILSKNFWQRRLALVLVEWHCREKIFHQRINKLVKQVNTDEEYYIKKAIVWINASLNKKR